MTEADQAFMRRAIALSAETSLVRRAGGAFGTVIVDKNGDLLAEGANRVVAENDPTWHGEIEAIRNACKKVGNFKLDDCTLYTSAECCPMCAAAAYWAGIKKIYFASTVEDALESSQRSTCRWSCRRNVAGQGRRCLHALSDLLCQEWRCARHAQHSVLVPIHSTNGDADRRPLEPEGNRNR